MGIKMSEVIFKNNFYLSLSKYIYIYVYTHINIDFVLAYMYIAFICISFVLR